MKPIHFNGLNCYHDCIISIADGFGVNYTAAFATLWSETDFSYKPLRGVYLTKRMIANLEALGAKVEDFDYLLPEDVETRLSLLDDSEMMIVGMDAFCIPWNPFYQVFHGPHYFIAENAKKDVLLCMDPTYNKENMWIARREIIAHAFDITTVISARKNPPRIDMAREAQEIIHTHANTREELLSHICGCINEERQRAALLAKYIDAMIQNRYLYRFFLERQSAPFSANHLLLNGDFFMKWKAVKNGLLKASICRNNEKMIHDVCRYLDSLLNEEIVMAEKMIEGSFE